MFSVNGKAARCRLGQTQKHFHRGRFSSPIWTEKTIDTAFADVKRNIVDRSEVFFFVFLCQLFGGDNAVCSMIGSAICNIVHKNISS